MTWGVLVHGGFGIFYIQASPSDISLHLWLDKIYYDDEVSDCTRSWIIHEWAHWLISVKLSMFWVFSLVTFGAYLCLYCCVN